MFDTLGEVIAGGLTLLAFTAMLLVFFRRGGRVTTPAFTVEEAEQTEDVEQSTTNACDSYQHEHMQILQELQNAVQEIKTSLVGMNTIHIAEVNALEVLLGLAEGDQINGQVANARRKLVHAQGFKDATDGIGGGA